MEAGVEVRRTTLPDHQAHNRNTNQEGRRPAHCIPWRKYAKPDLDCMTPGCCGRSSSLWFGCLKQNTARPFPPTSKVCVVGVLYFLPTFYFPCNAFGTAM
jgi:hypothetical protein